MKNKLYKAKNLIILFFILVSLFSCANLKKEKFDCSDSITVMKEGSIVDLKTIVFNNDAIARFNGVTALCYKKKNFVYMNVKTGLKVSREVIRTKKNNTDEVEIPFVLAILDKNENILLTDSFGYKVTFPSNKFITFPTVKFNYKFISESRVILSFTSEKIEK